MKKALSFISSFYIGQLPGSIAAVFYIIVFLSACNNLEDAKVMDRNTFIHFYESANNYVAATAQEVAENNGGGFIIGGTIELPLGRRILIIKINKLGLKEWATQVDGASISNLKVLPEGGFLVIGQSVVFNPNSTDIDELENYSTRLVKLSNGGEIIKDVSYSRDLTTDQGTSHVDYYGNAVAFDGNNDIITLGTFKEPGENEYAFITVRNKETLEPIWTKEYNYIVRNYSNSKSVFYNNNKILWATNISESEGNFKYSYLAIPVVEENSSFINNSYFGQNNEQQLLKIKDLQPSFSQYGAIGTYSQPDGTNGNIFFIRADDKGNFNENSVVYYDGFTLLNEGNILNDRTASNTEDTGEAIAATRDGGFVLAGTMQTTPSIGNGGKDIFLIKADPLGNPQWSKLLGGSTSETVSSIFETADGGLLICGTIQDGSESTGGLKSIFIMKTDSNGELKD